MILEFSRHIFEKWISTFMKIPPMGAKFFHVGGRTDMTKLSFFPTFATAPKNEKN
jgi:hypothetical protein